MIKIVHKMSLSLFAVLLLGLAAGGAITLRSLYSEIYMWFEQSANAVADSIATRATDYLSYFDYDAIQRMLDEKVAGDPSLEYATVSFGKDLAQSRNGGEPSVGDYREFTREISGEDGVLARVTIHYSTGIVNEKLYSMTRRMGVGAVLNVIVMALCLYGLVAYLINRPLVKLVRYTKILAAGDLSTRIEMGTRDEFDQLAENFNEMTVSLRDMVTKIRQTFSDLEAMAGDVNSVSQGLSAGTARQVDAVTTVSSSMAEMDSTIKSVAANVEAMSRVSEENSSSVLQIGASVEEVARSAENLAASVEQTSSSLNQMNTSIQGVAENVANLSGLIAEVTTAITEMDASIKEVETSSDDAFKMAEMVSATVAEEGVQTVEKAVQSMESIRETVLSATEVVRGLAASSDAIGEIIGIIEGVNDQTNLLALNAAIIAAQAGEQGRSFSVVANEIRELSDRTADATREIVHLISRVQSDSKDAETAMEKGARSVEEGVMNIQRVNTTLLDMKENTVRASTASQAIASTTTEQAKAAKQILQMAQNMSEMSTQISMATKEQSLGSEQISNAATTMRNMSIQVNQATMEQAKGVSSIGKASEKAMVMSQDILEASREEAKGSELILQSIQDIKEITEGNLRTVEGLDEMVKVLTQQSHLLKQEIDRFKVDGDGNVPAAAETEDRKRGQGKRS